MDRLTYIARERGRYAVSGAPEGYDAYLAGEAATRRKGLVLFVAADDNHAQSAADAMRFFAPGVPVLPFPAWDCLPYDRVSPKPDIESARLATLAASARARQELRPRHHRHHDQRRAAACAAAHIDCRGQLHRARGA